MRVSSHTVRLDSTALYVGYPGASYHRVSRHVVGLWLSRGSLLHANIYYSSTMWIYNPIKYKYMSVHITLYTNKTSNVKEKQVFTVFWNPAS